MALLSNLYASKQEPLKARDYVEKAATLTGGDPVLELYIALTYAMLGDQAEARKILQAIDPDNETRYISPGYFAMVYANLGEHDLAMEFLARSVEEYDSWIWKWPVQANRWSKISTKKGWIHFSTSPYSSTIQFPLLC